MVIHAVLWLWRDSRSIDNGKVKRRTTDYIFWSVEFDEGGKSYYYLNDDTFEVGDFVIVLAGK